MKLKNFIHSFFRFFGLKFERTVSSFGNGLAVYNIPREVYETKNGNIHFKELDLTIPLKKASPVLKRYANAVALARNGGFTFYVNKNGEIHASNHHVRFRINDEEEIFILTEVFLEGAYNLITPPARKIALIDIGMNVGVTSLFFASRDNVDKVYSFEPFTPTFEMAMENIKLNKALSKKITANNYGLAREERLLEVSYSTEQKGRMGINGLPNTDDYVLGDVSRQTMKVKSAAGEIARIQHDIKEHFVVCKIDTEGAEYEIVDSLYEAGLLSIANIYFIEWHEIKPTDIVTKLRDCDYYVVETAFRTANSGMIYAIRSEKQIP